MSKPKLYHPLWVHLPAFVLLGVMIAAFVYSMPLPDRVPVHWNWGGKVDRFGSPWENLVLIGFTALFVGICIVIDETWARSERTKKRFNWFSLIDELIAGFMTATLLGVLAVARQTNPPIPLRWDMILTICGVAVAMAAMLELLRPFHPKEEHLADEEDHDLPLRIGKLTEEGRVWLYWDVQNPAWMNWVITVTFVVLLFGSITLVSQNMWFALITLIMAMLILLLYGGMCTLVSPERLNVRLGMFGIPLLTLKTADIAEVKVHEFSPIADFGGWGIRGNREMKGYFFRGNTGVLIVTTAGRKYLVGSDQPTRLAMVIETARKMAN